MTSKHKHINQVRAQIDGLLPDSEHEPLPPQPSILEGTPEPTIIRIARKIDRTSNRLPGACTFIERVRPRNLKRHIQNQPRFATKGLVFRESARPVVSIVIPVYNKFSLTVKCLHSILDKVSRDITYEVIVVDNASSDASTYLAKIPGLQYVRNENNEGFVGGCNIGAAKAKGDYLVFLNNDALVLHGWLETLVSTITSTPNVGLVGSKIIYPDGRLQEAGGIIYQDGSGDNYGRNDHPDRYQYNYVREVDYCSGASIIIKRSLFESFGGFDTLYSPAYYEDTDLAFKVRKEGLKVVYQPKSVIYHIEGATAGTSTSDGFKKFQDINREKFINRWQTVLKTSHYTNDSQYLARDRSRNKLILLVDNYVPTPDKDSGSVRMIRMIQSLQSLDYKVTLFLNEVTSSDPYVKNLQQAGVEVVYGQISFGEFVQQRGQYYDAVLLARPKIASYFIDLCQAYCTKARLIYDTVDLHYLRLRRQAEFESGSQKDYLLHMAMLHETLEKHLMAEVDSTLVVSKVEKEILIKDGVKNVHVLSNIHKIAPSAYSIPYNNRKDLIFVGGFAHQPNIDAISWFVDNIFPEVINKIPDIKLHIVGSNMPSYLEDNLKKRHGIIVDGFVDDDTLHKLLQQSRLFLAPLRYGAGVKGKIGQAIEYGLPVISTTIGAEGMNLIDGLSAGIGDSPKEFADKIIETYESEKIWKTIQINAKKVIEDDFSVQAATDTFKLILPS